MIAPSDSAKVRYQFKDTSGSPRDEINPPLSLYFFGSLIREVLH
jgi:hypothetical protein